MLADVRLRDCPIVADRRVAVVSTPELVRVTAIFLDAGGGEDRSLWVIELSRTAQGTYIKDAHEEL
ncbi:hypothetical protein VMCG_00919 [Cytospora schulzeri]|uniref:Uncharacterized protein n=1 Tax=Cytospora schulzeri TaxID=448051 RepID=A0A423X582_9PEZI|nr:hypothetical protein VMCG_00919 [Valsa malicola]